MKFSLHILSDPFIPEKSGSDLLACAHNRETRRYTLLSERRKSKVKLGFHVEVFAEALLSLYPLQVSWYRLALQGDKTLYYVRGSLLPLGKGRFLGTI